MSHGWLVRCVPAEGRCEVELGEGATRYRHEGLEVAVAGRLPSAPAAGVPAGNPRHSPEAAVSTVVWSPAERALWLVRDRTGRHPLFHARAGRTLLASPDLRRLLAEPGVSREPSPIALAEWLLERPGPPEETLLAAVRRVPAGHVLRVDAHAERLTRDWAPPERGAHPAAAAARFGDVLETVVAGALDRPAAVFLSGGIDSASVAAAAAQASARAGLPSPLALCADLPEQSELATQRLVSDTLGIPRVERSFRPGPEALAQARALTAAALWPVQAAWAAVGEELLAAALADGRAVVLDGMGGDEVLDAGLAPARAFLRRGNVRALADLARAERGFSGLPARAVLRAALVPRRPTRPEPAPAWIADPALARALGERAAAPPPDDDLLDTFTAAGLETGVQAGIERGIRFVHPFYEPALVELLRGLPEAALVRGGEAKSPARAYLRQRLPVLTGRWPRPAVVAELLDTLLSETGRLDAPLLASLGVVRRDIGSRPQLAADERWGILSLEGWVGDIRGPGER